MSHSRRDILKCGTGLLLGAALSSLPDFALAGKPARILSLYNMHTGEQVKKLPYWERGRYMPHALGEINILLRDHRTDQVTRIDPRLLDILFTLQSMTDNHATYHVVSGYRSPKTNAMLRKHSKGVAEHSLHIQGKAIDLMLPGTRLAALRKAAIRLHAGGVGFYPTSNFLHIDSGRFRYW